MAASFSDENSAPVDFQISSTIGDNDSKSSSLREKCLLCNNLRKSFYCTECVQNGDFVSSTSKYPERYTDKKLQYLKLKSDKKLIESKCLKIIHKKTLKNNMELEINQYKERIKLLNQLIKDTSERNKKTHQEIENVREKNEARNTRLPRYKERVEKLRLYVKNNMSGDLMEKRRKLGCVLGELKTLKQRNIKDLMYYIFPITKIVNQKIEEDYDSTETICELAEATRTSYISGRWIYLDSIGESHYRIVAPTVPECGDYSAYNVWVASHKDGVVDDERIENNQAYNISAALCYTTQLTNLLAYYLDIILPKRMHYTDFCQSEMTESKFLKKVMKLNLNVLYLCLSQKVDTSLINPTHTLSNILQLLKTELGHVDPFEIDETLVQSLENKLECDMKHDEASDEDENVFPAEWEAVPLVPCPESSPGAALMSQHMGNFPSTTSVAGGLVTSLASIWRGWTGNRP